MVNVLASEISKKKKQSKNSSCRIYVSIFCISISPYHSQLDALRNSYWYTSRMATNWKKMFEKTFWIKSLTKLRLQKTEKKQFCTRKIYTREFQLKNSCLNNKEKSYTETIQVHVNGRTLNVEWIIIHKSKRIFENVCKKL